MLLIKTFRSSTFRLALINIAVFGAVVIALFGYVYWSTTSYVLGRTDRALSVELADLEQNFANGGRNELIEAINLRLAQKRADRVYALADELVRSPRRKPALLALCAGGRGRTG